MDVGRSATVQNGTGVRSRPAFGALAADPIRPPAVIAWLDVSADPRTWSGRGPHRAGPLGLRIAPLLTSPGPGPGRDLGTAAAVPPGAGRGAAGQRYAYRSVGDVERYAFRGARLRGQRSSYSAASVSGARLSRPAGARPAEPHVHLVATVASARPVFVASVETPAANETGTLSAFAAGDAVDLEVRSATQLFTLDVPLAMLTPLLPSVDGASGPASSASLPIRYGERHPLTPVQRHLLTSAAGLLVVPGDELQAPDTLVAVDRYLAALAGLLLCTAAPGGVEPALSTQVSDLVQDALYEHLRSRVDAIIHAQAADPGLTPAAVAAQLGVSLRQLYRAVSGSDSPAARIRRRRLELAAELLSARDSSPGQVHDVATVCGFESAEYFSRAFRREYGVSPRAYRSAHRTGDAAGDMAGAGASL